MRIRRSLVWVAVIGMLSACANKPKQASAEDKAGFFALFSSVCIETGGQLSEDKPPLSKLIEAGAAALSKEQLASINPALNKGWSFVAGSKEAPIHYALTQGNLLGHSLCAAHTNSFSAEEMRAATQAVLPIFGRTIGGGPKLDYVSKPLLGNPDIIFDYYQIYVIGKKVPAIFSLSTTDKPVREFKHEIAYEPAK